MIDVYYTSLTSQEIQHRVFYPDNNPVQRGLKCVTPCSPDVMGYIRENGRGRDGLTVLFADYNHWCLY